MSNSLYILSSAMAAASSSAPSSLPASHKVMPTPIVLVNLVVIGVIVLMVWFFRRVASPAKFTLAHAPNRPNNLNPAHIVVLLIVWFGGGIAANSAVAHFTDLLSGPGFVIVILWGQLLWLAASMTVAVIAFPLGLRRGLGLTLRHWVYDSARAVVAFLGVLPLCLLVLWIIDLLAPRQKGEINEVLKTMSSLKGPWLWATVFSAVVMAPLSEELFFRGLLQSMLRRYTRNPWMAILITSAFFAVVHRPWQDMPALFVLAVVLGYNYERCGRLYVPMLIHAVFNGLFTTIQITR